ncbi:MAG: hypothetical protein LBI69_01995 [Puniceicoccales bacterium]|jgi:chromosome segregation ATPase|nr:hypothetical protein [Puniceicoccales bacterium]
MTEKVTEVGPNNAGSGDDLTPGTVGTNGKRSTETAVTSHVSAEFVLTQMLDSLNAKAARWNRCLGSEDLSKEMEARAYGKLDEIDFARQNVFLLGAVSQYETAAIAKFRVTLQEYMLLNDSNTAEERQSLCRELSSLRRDIKEETAALAESRTRAEKADALSREEAAKQAVEATKRAAEEARQAAKETEKKDEEVKRAAEEARQAAKETEKKDEEVKRAAEEARQAAKETEKKDEEVKRAAEEAKQAILETARKDEEVKRAAEEARQAAKETEKKDEEVKRAAEEAKQAVLETARKDEEVKWAAEKTRQEELRVQIETLRRQQEELKVVQGTKTVALLEIQRNLAICQTNAANMATAWDRHAARSWIGQLFFSDAE